MANKNRGRYGRYDLELLIESWSHDHFGGTGDFKQKLECLLNTWDLAAHDLVSIQDEIFNIWLPEFIHYFEIGDPTIDEFITAITARLLWCNDNDEVMKRVEPKDRLWSLCLSVLNSDEKLTVAKGSIDIGAILKSIEIGSARVPSEIAAWLFDDLRDALNAEQEMISIATEAKKQKDCPTSAQDFFLVTNRVRTHIVNLLIKG